MTKTGHLFIDVRKIRERGRKIPKISRENVGFFTPSLTFSGSVVNLTKVFIFITLSIDRFTVDISSYEIVLGPQSLPTSPVFRQRSSPPDLFHHLRNNQTVKKHPSLFHVQLWNTLHLRDFDDGCENQHTIWALIIIIIGISQSCADFGDWHVDLLFFTVYRVWMS